MKKEEKHTIKKEIHTQGSLKPNRHFFIHALHGKKP
jgi:hypothetical protein